MKTSRTAPRLRRARLSFVESTENDALDLATVVAARLNGQPPPRQRNVTSLPAIARTTSSLLRRNGFKRHEAESLDCSRGHVAGPPLQSSSMLFPGVSATPG